MKKLYGGHKTVFCSFLCLFFIQIFYTNSSSLYTGAITAEFGFDRAPFTLYLSIASAVMLFCSPVVGKLMQKYNPKYIMSGALIIQIISYLGFTISSQLWHFYVFSIGLGIAFATVIRVGPTTLVNFWFGPKVKSRYITIVSCGNGVGSIVILPLVTYVVTNFGWRYGYYLTAAVEAILILPCFLFLISTPAISGEPRRGDLTAEEAGEKKNAGKVEGRSLKLSETIRQPEFYFMAVAMILVSVAATGLLTNVQLFFIDVGFDPMKAAWICSFATGIGTLGKIIDGIVIDRFGIKIGTLYAGSLYVIGVASLIFVTSTGSLAYIGFIVGYALGGSLTTLFAPIMTSYMWGADNYGANYGAVNLMSSVGSIIGPSSMALVYDMTGTYVNAWIAIAVGLVITVACYLIAMSLANRRKAREMVAMSK